MYFLRKYILCINYAFIYLYKQNAIIMTNGVIIARFQTPYLHEGHVELIRSVQESHNRVIILLGISRVTGTRKNPYDYYTREKLIKAQFPTTIVLPLSDHPSDKAWSDSIDHLLTTTFPGTDFELYGSRDSFIPYYKGNFKTTELDEHGEFNASEIREQYADKVYESKDFRAGILYAVHNQYKKVYPTVDVAVFRNDKQEILLGRKRETTDWRLLGGFVDPEDEGYEQAAARELREEAGALETSEMTYEASRKVDDWRYRNEDDKIITTLYSCDYVFGEAKANDDIVEINWFPVKELGTMIKNQETAPEHAYMLNLLFEKYTI